MATRKLAGMCLLALALAGVGCDVSVNEEAPKDAANDKDDSRKDDQTPMKGGEPSAGSMADGTMEPQGQAETDTSVEEKDGVTPEVGETEFVSADPNAATGDGVGRNAAGQGTAGGSAAPPSTPAPGAPVAEEGAADSAANAGGDFDRSVERGDIFKLLDDGRIVNFNQYRGVQVIDVRDPSSPKIEGRLRLNGYPVEMYVVEDRAVLLLNNYQNYYGTRDDVRVERREGGLIAVIDISDRSAPKLVDKKLISGSISTSRLTREGDKSAIYVASQQYEVFQTDPVAGREAGDAVATTPASGGPTTVLTSFDVSGPSIVQRNKLELGGYVTDIQASTEVMMVASNDYTRNEPGSRVSLVDISDAAGKMVMGAEIEIDGIVQNKFNMDIYNDVLRVVSASDWNSQSNTVDTFDVSDLSKAVPLDSCDFGLGQQLYATLFVENRAFFVTYFRQDPFHAFAIGDDGSCEEQNAFVVSGWNDFFRAVEGDTRLVGIGQNDENRSNTLAVSLYDITDLSNEEPLLARAEVDLSWSSSEASWDDRAFSVLEDAVSVPASDGTVETGLILLPFQGSENVNGEYSYRTGVQIFTFSASTLTRRGEMSQVTSVRRTFLTDDTIAANLSDVDLTLHDISDVDEPSETGVVEVAPNYGRVFKFGDHVVRVREFAGGYYYGNQEGEATVEVLAKGADPDLAAAIASFKVPTNAQLRQVGDLLVSYVSDYAIEDSKETHDTEFSVYDLSDPTKPVLRGETTASDLFGQGGYFGGPIIDCFDCRYSPELQALATSSALVFAVRTAHSEFVDSQTVCYEYPSYYCSQSGGGSQPSMGAAGTGGSVGSDPAIDAPPPIAPPPDQCEVFYEGSIRCVYDDDGEESCSGEFYRCDTMGCEEIDRDELPIPPNRNCNQEENWRYWDTYRFEVLDLTDPTAPKMTKGIEMPEEYQGTSARVFGDTLYFNSAEPIEVPGDARGYLKRYFQHIDLQTPSKPVVSSRINIPGELIAVDGDAIITQDIVWDDAQVESLLARLELQGDKARLLARRLFDDRQVQDVRLDGAGHVLVSHGPAYWLYERISDKERDLHTLSILSEETLKVLGEAEIDTWASLVGAAAGRALYSVSGGLLMINVEDPQHPVAQAYFPLDYYGSYVQEQTVVLDGERFILAGGPYGLYALPLDEANLEAP